MMAYTLGKAGAGCWIGLIVCLAFGSPARGEGPAETFELLYGEDLRQARATAQTDDDLALARRMLEAAAVAEAQPSLAELLCEGAWQLASAQRDGYATAIEALERLAALNRDQRDAYRDRMIGLAFRRYRGGGADERAERAGELVDLLVDLAEQQAAEGRPARAIDTYRRAQRLGSALPAERRERIAGRLTELASLRRTHQRIEQYRQRLERSAADHIARRALVELYLVDLDQPEQAAAWVEGLDDAEFVEHVKWAAKPLENLPNDQALSLAQWYSELARTASGPARVSLLERVVRYGKHFLDRHAARDLDHTRATLLSERAEGQLARLAPEPAAAGGLPVGRWIDLLEPVDPQTHAVSGQWTKTPRGLAAATDPFSRIVLPVVPRGDYELVVKFARLEGSQRASLILPIGGRRAAQAAIGAGHGTYAGLALVDEKTAYDTDNPTVVKLPERLASGKAYAAGARVTGFGDAQVRIQVSVDGRPIIDWTGPSASLDLSPTWDLPTDHTPGLACMEKMVFTSVRLKMLNGSAEPLKPEDE